MDAGNENAKEGGCRLYRLYNADQRVASFVFRTKEVRTCENPS